MTEPGEKVKTPEVPFNNVLLQSLRSVDRSLGSKGNSPFVSAAYGIAINTERKNLITVTGNDIVIAGKSFQDMLVKPSTLPATPDINQRLDSFLNGISENLVRLNHVGISYFCDDLQEEIQNLGELSKSADIPLYEERSSEPDEKWLFIGNTNNWEDPMVEFVLNNTANSTIISWKPAFQIDVDTTLTLEQVKALTDQYLGKGFVQWQLDIPDYGTVLAMGLLGSVGNAKIALGIGTNLRGTEDYRKNELKPL